MRSSGGRFRLITRQRRAKLNVLRDAVEPILRNRLHTHFTDHSIVHCDRVAELAEKLLIPLKTSAKLVADEAFVLYGGCYLHDIGMHYEKAGEVGRLAAELANAGRTWADVPQHERLDLIRARHFEISADMVLASVRNGTPPINFTFDDHDCPAEIAAICEAHCMDTASPRYDELTQKGGRSTMRTRLLAAILRLADVLDEAHHRALIAQSRTLDLNIESRMHWWRHRYTREIEVEPEKNRITIWFGFPIAKRDQYAKLVPALQMPWVEKELDRHRAVLAENGLSWHIGWQVHEGPFETVDEMPPEIESFMLQELARRTNIAARQSRVEALKHFDQSRAQILSQLHGLHAVAETSPPDECLGQTLRLADDLWRLGSRLTARHWLRSKLFFATTNGRSVGPVLHIRAAIRLARMQADDNDVRGAVQTLMGVERVVDSLDEGTSEKIEYFRTLASLALSAGYFKEGCSAARRAIELLGPGPDSERVQAELAEAMLLEGQHPIAGYSGGEV